MVADIIKPLIADTIALASSSVAVVATGVAPDGFIVHELKDVPKIIISLAIAVISRFAFKWIDDYFKKQKAKSNEKTVKRN